MRQSIGFYKLKGKLFGSRYALVVAALLLQLAVPLMQISPVSAAPTISDFPISSTYTQPGAMTLAGGDLWYLEKSSSSSAIDSIGRITTSGVTTDYPIGYPPSKTIFTVSQLVTGSDGNVWFIGTSSSYSVYVGKLDISTGSVTFYSSGISAFSGQIGTSPNSNIYYTVKSSDTYGNTYLYSLNPATGIKTFVTTYDKYVNVGSIAGGPDGRLYITDGFNQRIYAQAVSGGTSGAYNVYMSVGDAIAGPDGNVWFRTSGGIVKMTTSGVTTTYALPTGVTASKLISGSDGAIWFTGNNGKIGRVKTSDGSITTYTSPGTSSSISSGILGPDGAIWFSYSTSSPTSYKIGRFGY